MICENCGKEHNGSYGSGRFCCKECARAYSGKHHIKGKKEVKCNICGKNVYVNKFSSKRSFYCEDCKQKIAFEKFYKYKQLHLSTETLTEPLNLTTRQIKKTKQQICPICGRIKNANGKCNNEFCNQHNYQHFKSLIKYFGFDKSKFGTEEVEQEFNRVRNILYDLYWNQNLSSTELAQRFNYKSTPTNITQKFFKNYLHIPVKSVKYSVIENYIEGRESIGEINNQYKQQWYTTWNNKEVFLRSSYELDYAKELDEQKIDYDVECLRIKYWNTIENEYKCAIPDFYISSLNMIVEIKSNWTLNVQEMKDKVKAYNDLGYNFKLILEHQEVDLETL